MKILFVLTRADEIGGVQVHIRDMASALADAGHDVVVAAGAEGHAAAQIKSQGTSFVPLLWLERSINPLSDIRAVVELKNVIVGMNPDIVSLHSSKAGFVGRIACKLAKTPVIFTAHGWAFTDGVGKNRQRIYKTLERLATFFADRVITVSEYDKQLAVASRVGKSTDFVAIHNGMPVLDVGYPHRKNDRPVRLIMVARLSAQKDHEILLRALAKLKGHSWQLELVGGGDGQAYFEKLAISLGVMERVRFTGQVDDVASHLNKSDIFVLATKWEGLPRSIIEAMRSGLPVVASDVGGISELVSNGENGFLVQRGDADALATSLSTLIDNYDLRQEMGAASFRRFSSEFSFNIMFEKTVSIYKEVVRDDARYP